MGVLSSFLLPGVLLAQASALSPGGQPAQATTRIADIASNAGAYHGKFVALTGTVESVAPHPQLRQGVLAWLAWLSDGTGTLKIVLSTGGVIGLGDSVRVSGKFVQLRTVGDAQVVGSEVDTRAGEVEILRKSSPELGRDWSGFVREFAAGLYLIVVIVVLFALSKWFGSRTGSRIVDRAIPTTPALLAVGILGTVVLLAISRAEIPKVVSDALLIVVGYYFGQRNPDKEDEVERRREAARTAEEKRVAEK